MRRLYPQSLLGQVMLSVALALLVAQVVSVILLYRAGEERRQAAMLTAATFQIVNGAQRAQRSGGESFERLGNRGPRGRNGARRNGGEPGALGRLPRALRYTVSDSAPLSPAEIGDEDANERRLRATLEVEDVEVHRIAVATRRAGDDPVLQEFARTRPRFNLRTEWRERTLVIVALQRAPGGAWEAARMLDPVQPRRALGGIVFQTLIAFALLMVVLYFVLRRITRPLAELTERMSTFSRSPDQAVQLEEKGPADTRRLIAAHNAMEARISALLDEKDVMLGAIGHDLKTPLAALRVRIESVPDDAQRAKMADSIEDITATLDDILALARVGRSGGLDAETVDLGMLALGVAEEFEDMGEAVTIGNPPRTVARVQVTWIKRALRNLVSNALRYGKSAEIVVDQRDGLAVLRVEDKGPGIPEDRIAEMLEPFTRGEGSRNRATGGAGLGLTLARAIAEQHGGQLVLANRAGGGLGAEIRLPL